MTSESPPSTPPAEIGTEPDFWRFEDTGAPCEWAEEYRPGGYYPVNLGDTFCDGKYRVIRKLGYGSYSTVWLAVRSGTPRFVALKILIAKAKCPDLEIEIAAQLYNAAPDDNGSRHITTLLDHFVHQGPNGRHQCLVLELMGADAATLVEQLPENKPKMYGKVERYPKWLAKKILLHTLRGLTFLHRNGIVHGDLQPGNLLLSMADLNYMEENAFAQDVTETAVPLQRIDGKVDRWAPRHLYPAQPLHENIRLDAKLMVKLSEFGSAFRTSQPPTKAVTPIALRAPEIILKQPIGPGIDIWCFGCLMFEFLTGRTLFAVGVYGNDQKDRDDADDDHLIQFIDIIRPLPDSVMAAWSRAHNWYDDEGQRLQPYSDEEPFIHGSLQDMFARNKLPEIYEVEENVLVALMGSILEYDPKQRPGAEQLLMHPWFSKTD
ncbi:putative serine protein kinase [Paraphoma chrysanthemicola]|uniref:non-specific serine/threonine protein kinase n=1 Tax=Paraphoma chrysanthemicola TaxID=798071 RepID=A0A8K0R293_9PLEO|nr:putative serine protein kinase [Paraphoma chrysanthemicola]